MTRRTPVTDVTSTAPVSLTDRAHREWYLFRFDWSMQDYPRKEFRRIKKDLRTELTTAAMDVGMARALSDVGHPRVLAERYISELGRRLPRWATGTVVATVAVSVVMYMMMFYSIGSLDTLEAVGGGAVTFHPLGSEVVFTNTETELSVESNASWGWLGLYAGVAAVSFLLGSRVWRAF